MSEEIMNIGSAEGDQVLELDINRLRAFKNHPFKVTADMSMVELKDSIEKYGMRYIIMIPKTKYSKKQPPLMLVRRQKQSSRKRMFPIRTKILEML